MGADFSRTLLVALCLAGTCLPAFADIVTDGTAGPALRLNGPEFQIGAELGTQAGRNLFHSFEWFNLQTGERATFSGPDAIENVIGRVTGGVRSDVNGTLRSTIPGADLWFINPSGVVFGPNARLDLQGSFHVSTADEVRFADGATLSASKPAGSSFTVAAPEAFGFIGADPAPILVDRSTLQVPAGEALSLVGGDIAIRGDPAAPMVGGLGTLVAEAGTITLAAAAGPAQLRLPSGELNADRRADIVLRDQILVDVSGDRGGAIRIDGGDLVLEGRSFVVAGNIGASDAVSGIRVGAERVRIADGSFLATSAHATGAAGPVTIETAELQVRGGGNIVSFAFGEGDAGAVTVGSDRLVLEGGIIGSNAFAGGDAGAVTVAAGRVLIRSGTSGFASGILSEATSGSGDAGTVQIAANEIEMLEGAVIGSRTFGQGDAGAVTVAADRLLIRRGESANRTSISSSAETGSSGRGGAVRIVAGDLQILEGGSISSDTFTDGDAGAVTVEAERLVIRRGAAEFTGISSDAERGSGGNAGTVRVVAGEVAILEGGEVRTSTFGRGDAGAVTVEADRLLIRGGASAFVTGISSNAEIGSSGNAGTVRIVADELAIPEGGYISTSTFAGGNAGTVTVEADRVLIRRGAARLVTAISSSTQPGMSGNAGAVRIEAGELKVLDGAEIRSLTFGAGDAGNVGVNAGRLLIRRGEVTTAAATEVSGAVGQGDTGRIRIQAETVELADGGRVSSSADGPGRAGDVVILAADRLIVENASITTDSQSGGGGEIEVRVGNVIDLLNSAVTTSVAGGDDPTAGNILIDPKFLIIDNSRIRANAPVGFGGNVTIVADNILVPGGSFETLLRRGDISATGGDPSRAGTVVVNVPEVDLAGGLVVLEGAFIDVAPLRERCDDRRDVGASSLTRVGRGGLAAGPEAQLAVGYSDPGRAAAVSSEAKFPADSSTTELPVGRGHAAAVLVMAGRLEEISPCRGPF